MNANARPPRPPARRRQRGMSTIAVLALVSVAIFVGLFAVKVAPAYFENATIEKIVETKAADASLMKAPRSKVYQALNQAYRHNNLWDMRAEDTIKLKKDGARGYLIEVAYEKRANLFANIDVVTVFGEPETEEN